MSNSDKIKELVERYKLDCVLIVDTNILMYKPEISCWAVGSRKSLFVVPAVVIWELKHIKDCDDKQARESAKKAILEWNSLQNLGSLVAGVQIAEGNFVLATQLQEKSPSPSENEEPFKMALGAADIQVLKVAREIQKEVSATPVRLLTNDRSLAAFAPLFGVDSFVSRDPFGDDTLPKVLGDKTRTPGPVEPKEDHDLLQQMSDLIGKPEVASVEFTLLGKEVGEDRFIARGSGTVLGLRVGGRGDERIDFEWEAYYWTYSEVEQRHDIPGLGVYGIAPVEGLAFRQKEPKVSLALKEAIARKLEGYAHPSAVATENGRTFQSPLSIVDFLFEIGTGAELSYYFTPHCPWIQRVNEDNIRKLQTLVSWTGEQQSRLVGSTPQELAEAFYRDAVRFVSGSWNIGESIRVSVEYYPYSLSGKNSE